jgi:serine/threonine protein kinase
MKNNKESKYIRTTKLGEGTYGVVYRAKDQKGQEIYALKKYVFKQKKKVYLQQQ